MEDMVSEACGTISYVDSVQEMYLFFSLCQ